MRTAVSAILLLSLCHAGGCGRDAAPSLDAFQQRWHDAVNKQAPEALYHLLDARSRGMIDRELHRLRGLTTQEQQHVINHLGGDRIDDLSQMPADRYFGLWWRQVTGDQSPTMKLEAAGESAAYMVLGLDGRSERYALHVEGGRWAWSLPEQDFGVKPLEHDNAPGSEQSAAKAAAARDR